MSTYPSGESFGPRRQLSGDDQDFVATRSQRHGNAQRVGMSDARGGHPRRAFRELGGRCERRARDVQVMVSDEGRWRTVRSQAGGRGLSIMRHLMDSVEIDRDEFGTLVTMTRRLCGSTHDRHRRRAR